jgi:hypothetical protein
MMPPFFVAKQSCYCNKWQNFSAVVKLKNSLPE